MDDAEPAPEATGAILLFHDRYEIQVDAPLPDLASPLADAYTVVDTHESHRRLYALASRTEQPFRADTLFALRQQATRSLVHPVAWGSDQLPGAAGACSLIVLRRPMGERLAYTNLEIENRIPVAKLNLLAIEPINEALKLFAARRAAHRAVRPDNIFFTDGREGPLVLGECFTAPPGFYQPIVFEPIERAMADPHGRGTGTVVDDMYAFGVTLALLVSGTVPLMQASDEDVVREKLRSGSYHALLGESNVPNHMFDLLRGLLCDDPVERWRPDEVAGWVEGKRVRRAKSKPDKLAERPFIVDGVKCYTTRELAYAIAGEADLAGQLIKSGQIQMWVEEVLHDRVRAKALTDAARSGSSEGQPRTIKDDVLMARVLMALDPRAPVRFRGMSVMPDGLGAALLAANGDSERIKACGAMIDSMLFANWGRLQPEEDSRGVNAVEMNARLGRIMAQQIPGQHFERCLYEMNPAMHCLSPRFAQARLDRVEDVMLAIEARAQSEKSPLDRHLSAFLAARSKASLERSLNEVAAAKDEAGRTLATVRMLSRVQDSMGPRSMPDYARAVLPRLEQIVQRFNNTGLKQQLLDALHKAAEDGRLTALIRIVEDPRYRDWDRKGFEQARAQFRWAGGVIESQIKSAEPRPQLAKQLGHTIAAYVSCGIAMIAMFVTLVVQLG